MEGRGGGGIQRAWDLSTIHLKKLILKLDDVDQECEWDFQNLVNRICNSLHILDTYCMICSLKNVVIQVCDYVPNTHVITRVAHGAPSLELLSLAFGKQF